MFDYQPMFRELTLCSPISNISSHLYLANLQRGKEATHKIFHMDFNSFLSHQMISYNLLKG